MNMNNSNNGRVAYSTFVLIVLASIAIMAMYVEAMAFPSLPKIMASFGLGPQDYALGSWIITIYMITGAISITIFGKLGDIYGKKKMLLIAMSIYTVGVTLTGFSPQLSDSIYLMIAFRAVQGVSMSMFPLAFSLIRDEFPRDRIAIAQGVISAMFGVGTAVGMVLGGFVTDTWGWEWTFHSVIPVSIALTLLVAWKIRESPIRMKVKVDLVGAALLGTTLFSFLVGITESKNRGWSDPLIVSLLILSAVLLASFAFWITRAKDPLIRPALLKIRDIALTNVIAFMIGFALFTVNQVIAALAGFNFGLDATSIGLLMLPTSIVILFVGPTAGFVVRKNGPKWPMVFGMTVSIIGFMLLYQWHYTELEVMVGVAVMGMGNAFTMVSSINMIIISTPIEETAVSSAINMVIRTGGGVVGPAIAAVIISQYSQEVPGLPQPIPDDIAYQIIFLMSSVMMGFGVLLSLWLSNKKALPEARKGGVSAEGPSGA